MILWALLYEPDATSGTLRIARAVGNQVADNMWTYDDFNPQDFMAFAAGTRMDFPTMTVSCGISIQPESRTLLNI